MLLLNLYSIREAFQIVKGEEKLIHFPYLGWIKRFMLDKRGPNIDLIALIIDNRPQDPIE